MGITPRRNSSIFRSLMSMQVTSTPMSAKQVPDTSPTYPVPTMANFMIPYVQFNKCITHKKKRALPEAESPFL
jgi:hypothetical protein